MGRFDETTGFLIEQKVVGSNSKKVKLIAYKPHKVATKSKLAITLSLLTLRIKAAQSNETIKFSKPKRISRFYSTNLKPCSQICVKAAQLVQIKYFALKCVCGHAIESN